jgi:hypothetical protein
MAKTTKQPPHSGAIRSAGPLGSPTLTFDLTAEIKGLREENAWQGGRNSKTLVKNEDFGLCWLCCNPMLWFMNTRRQGEFPCKLFLGTFKCMSRTRSSICPQGIFWRWIARFLMT